MWLCCVSYSCSFGCIEDCWWALIRLPPSLQPLVQMNLETAAVAAATGSEKPKEKGGKKRLSVERIYQRKTQLEHILLRPDTYVGSVEEVTENMWVYDEEKEVIVKRQISFVPGLYKIFDEILGMKVLISN